MASLSDQILITQSTIVSILTLWTVVAALGIAAICCLITLCFLRPYFKSTKYKTMYNVASGEDREIAVSTFRQKSHNYIKIKNNLDESRTIYFRAIPKDTGSSTVSYFVIVIVTLLTFTTVIVKPVKATYFMEEKTMPVSFSGAIQKTYQIMTKFNRSNMEMRNYPYFSVYESVVICYSKEYQMAINQKLWEEYDQEMDKTSKDCPDNWIAITGSSKVNNVITMTNCSDNSTSKFMSASLGLHSNGSIILNPSTYTKEFCFKVVSIRHETYINYETSIEAFLPDPCIYNSCPKGTGGGRSINDEIKPKWSMIGDTWGVCMLVWGYCENLISLQDWLNIPKIAYVVDSVTALSKSVISTLTYVDAVYAYSQSVSEFARVMLGVFDDNLKIEQFIRFVNDKKEAFIRTVEDSKTLQKATWSRNLEMLDNLRSDIIRSNKENLPYSLIDEIIKDVANITGLNEEDVYTYGTFMNSFTNDFNVIVRFIGLSGAKYANVTVVKEEDYIIGDGLYSKQSIGSFGVINNALRKVADTLNTDAMMCLLYRSCVKAFALSFTKDVSDKFIGKDIYLVDNKITTNAIGSSYYFTVIREKLIFIDAMMPYYIDNVQYQAGMLVHPRKNRDYVISRDANGQDVIAVVPSVLVIMDISLLVQKGDTVKDMIMTTTALKELSVSSSDVMAYTSTANNSYVKNQIEKMENKSYEAMTVAIEAKRDSEKVKEALANLNSRPPTVVETIKNTIDLTGVWVFCSFNLVFSLLAILLGILPILNYILKTHFDIHFLRKVYGRREVEITPTFFPIMLRENERTDVFIITNKEKVQIFPGYDGSVMSKIEYLINSLVTLRFIRSRNYWLQFTPEMLTTTEVQTEDEDLMNRVNLEQVGISAVQEQLPLGQPVIFRK